MTLEIKSGPMLWYKRRFFGRNWRDFRSVLYNDSSFVWYAGKSGQESKGALVLKDAPELIAYGTYTSQVPDRPNLPDPYEEKELLAFGVRGTKTIYWFLCPNEEEAISWMGAIASTLPSQPWTTPPPQMHSSTANHEQTLASHYPTGQSTPQYNAGQAEPQHQPIQDVPNHQQIQNSLQTVNGLPDQNPQQTNNGVSPQATTSGGNGPTTAVVRQYCKGYCTCGVGGGFAMGMQLGGTAVGSNHFGVGGGWRNVEYWCHGSSVKDVSVEQTVPEPAPLNAEACTPVENATDDAPVAEQVEYLPVENSAEGLPGQNPQQANNAVSSNPQAHTSEGNEPTKVVDEHDRKGYCTCGIGGAFAMGVMLQGTAAGSYRVGVGKMEGWENERGWRIGSSVREAFIEQADAEQTFPEAAFLKAEECAPVAEQVKYIPMENPGGGIFDGGGYDADCGVGDCGVGDCGGGDCGGGDFGGGDFGGGDFGICGF